MESLAKLRITLGVTPGDSVTIDGKTVTATTGNGELFARKLLQELDSAISMEFEWEAKERRFFFWKIMEATPVWVVTFKGTEFSE